MEMEAIRRIIIEAKTTGIAEAQAQLTRLGESQKVLAQTSDSSARASLSQERALESTTRALDGNYRAQQQLAKQVAVLNASYAQGLLSTQRHAELVGMATAAYERQGGSAQKATGVMAAFGQATSGVSAQLIALSAGAGPVGVFLSALGPWGLAAAVGLGAVGAAFRYVEQESARMGDKAIELRQFSEATGLTRAQMTGIKEAASGFGIAGETIATGFERLTFTLNDARERSGALYEGILTVDRGLADQLTQTTTTAQGIDVIARAYRDAGNEAKKLEIARAVFGRGGSAAGPVLGAIADAGGISNLHALTEATDEQTRAWAKMRAETEEMEKKARNILASIFTDEGLAAAHKAAEVTLQVAKNIKELSAQQEGLSVWQRLMSNIARQGLQEGGMSGEDISQMMAQSAARQRITQGIGSNLGVNEKDIASWHALEDAMNGVVPQMEEVSKTYLQVQQAAQAAANEESKRIGLLGNAATMEEHHLSKLTDLTAAYLKNKISAEDYARAVDAVNLDDQIAKTQSLIGALGDLAPAELRVAEALQKIQKFEQGGGSLTDSQKSGIAARAQVQGLESQIPDGTYERQADALQKLIALYPGLSTADAKHMRDLENQIALANTRTKSEELGVQQAIRVEQLMARGLTGQQAATIAARERAVAEAQIGKQFDDQLQALQAQAGVANAVTGAQQIMAQAAAAGAKALRDGATAEQAQAIAAQTAANAFAQVNAQAKGQLLSLQDQLAASQAITGEQKIQADAQATYNQLVRAGVSDINAQAVAEQQVANAHAAATASVIKETISLREQTELIEARLNGTEAIVRAEQAFNKALREGADLEAAIALRDATQDNARAQENAQRKSGGGVISPVGALYKRQLDEFTKYGGNEPANPAIAPAYRYRSPTTGDPLAWGQYDEQQLRNRVDQTLSKGGGLQGALDMLRGLTVNPGSEAARSSVMIDLLKRIADQTGDKSQEIAGIQAELDRLRAQPETLARDDMIKQLMDELKANTDAVNDNTSATSQLSDIYLTDPRLSHLGFRPESQPIDPSKLGPLPSVTSPSVVPAMGGGVVGAGDPFMHLPVVSGGGGGLTLDQQIAKMKADAEAARLARNRLPYGGGPSFMVPPNLSHGFSFADGGVMTDHGPIPLRRYGAGGIANSPQMAIYGERPGVSEAYVPLPDGRSIPAVVKLQQPSQRPMVVNHAPTIVINGPMTDEMLDRTERSLFQKSQDLHRSLRGHK